MKHKINLIASSAAILILTAIIGACISLHHCMEWETYCDDGTLPLLAIRHTQNMIFHAYYWMGIAFVCLCLMTAMMVWYFRQQQKRHPELVDLMADTSECELHKIQVNIYTNEIIIDGIAYPSRCQVVSLLDYLMKQPTHEISFTDLNTVFNENFFDGTPASKRRISNLKYEVNDLLKSEGFEMIKVSPDRFALTTTNQRAS